MKRPHASDDVRERALAAVDAGRRVADVAAFYGNDPSPIRRWLRQRARTGSGLSRPRPGRARLLGADQAAALAAQLAAHPDATLAEHCRRWLAEHGVRLSLSTMRRAILRLGVTLKKDADCPRAGHRGARHVAPGDGHGGSSEPGLSR